MQQPSTYNLQIYQGSYFLRKFVYKINGSPADLTGYTARAQIRSSYAGAILATPTITIPTPTNGTIIFEIPATTTAALTASGGVWDMELVPPSGEDKVTRLVQGIVSISPEVTKQ